MTSRQRYDRGIGKGLPKFYSGAGLHPSTKFIAVSAGVAHTCGVTKASKQIHCWGSEVTRNGPVTRWGNAIWPAFKFKAVSMGNSMGCCLTTESEVKCFGYAQGGTDPMPTKKFTSV